MQGVNQDLNRPQPVVVPEPASCVEIHEEGDLDLLAIETDPIEVIEPIEEEVATEEMEISAEVIEPIEGEELVEAVEPEEQAKAEGVMVVNPVEAGPKMIAIEGVIPDISEQSADKQSGVEVITTASIEEKVAIAEVVIVSEPEEQAMAEIPAEVIEPIEEEVATEEVGVIQTIEEEVAMKEVETPAEVEVIRSIEEKVAIAEVVVVSEPEEQAMKEVEHAEVEEQEVVLIEGVTVVNLVEAGHGIIEIEGVISDISEQSADERSGVGVITAPIEAEEAVKEVVVITEPDEQAMERVNRVKYKDFQDELVPAEEHITIMEIQVKNTAHDINVLNTNSCIHDFMMDLTGYDPGGPAGVKEALRFKQDYVRREESLLLKRNIAGISLNVSAEALGHRDAAAIAGWASYVELFRRAEEVWFGHQEPFPTAWRLQLQRRLWDDNPVSDG